jgi:polysaccharide pyruvyl transferase WcaK-like protein
MTRKKNMNICILGSYSGSNIGDSEILIETTKRINLDYPDSTIFIPTFNVTFIKSLNIENLIPIENSSSRINFFSFRLMRLLKKIDIIVTTSGIFHARNFFKSSDFMIPMLVILFFYKILNSSHKIYGYYISVYKPETIFQKSILHYLLSIHKVVLPRDSYTYSYLVDLNIVDTVKNELDIVLSNNVIGELKNIRSIAFIASPYISGDNNKGSQKELSIFSSNLKDVKGFLANKNVEFSVYVTSSSDTLFIDNNSMILTSRSDLESRLRKYDLVISMRLHGFIMSLNAGINSYACTNLHKNKTFLLDGNLESQAFECDKATFLKYELFSKQMEGVLNSKAIKVITNASTFTLKKLIDYDFR